MKSFDVIHTLEQHSDAFVGGGMVAEKIKKHPAVFKTDDHHRPGVVMLLPPHLVFVL